ncbi:hypothetical protein V8C26DRAFT_367128 [Trichoderma gracile]
MFTLLGINPAFGVMMALSSLSASAFSVASLLFFPFFSLCLCLFLRFPPSATYPPTAFSFFSFSFFSLFSFAIILYFSFYCRSFLCSSFLYCLSGLFFVNWHVGGATQESRVLSWAAIESLATSLPSLNTCTNPLTRNPLTWPELLHI